MSEKDQSPSQIKSLSLSTEEDDERKIQYTKTSEEDYKNLSQYL